MPHYAVTVAPEDNQDPDAEHEFEVEAADFHEAIDEAQQLVANDEIIISIELLDDQLES